MKKKIYFVRHGEVDANVQNLFQGGEGKLTEKGRKQAEFVAERFRTIPIDTIISSSYERTVETAEYMEAVLRAGIVISDLFIERKVPKEYIGRSRRDQECKDHILEVRKYADDPDWHFSDEENFSDLKKRSREALTFLAEREEENLLVVTHGGFLKALVGYMCFGEMFSAKEFYGFVDTFRTSNTALTLCTYDSDSRQPWMLYTWNDHAHLGEGEVSHSKN